MPPSLLVAEVGGIVVIVQGDLPPADPDWERFLEIAHRRYLAELDFGVLVVSAGGHPSPLQQRRINEQTAGIAVPIAIVSDAEALRRVARMLSMHNPLSRWFSTQDLAKALDYLNARPDQHDGIRATIAELQQQLAATNV